MKAEFIYRRGCEYQNKNLEKKLGKVVQEWPLQKMQHRDDFTIKF